jgi:GT2 family glycosyltransferase
VRIAVIVVNYNGAHLLPDCLDGLEAQVRPADEVIVVDNGSTDGSQQLIRNSYPWVKLIESGSNQGFAGGNNLGIRSSNADIVILLNNDTLPSPGFVEQIVEPLERDPALSAVAGTLLFSGDPEVVATAGIDVYENGIALDSSTGVDWRGLPSEHDVFGPSGGAVAFRRTALEDVGMFAEPYFLYLEDADLAWRMRLREHRTVSVAGAWVHHVYSASAGESSPLKDYFLSRNRIWTLIRCWPSSLWRRHWRPVLLYEVGALGYAVLSRRWAIVRGRIDGWFGYFRLRRSRRQIQWSRTCPDLELLYWVKPNPSVRNILMGRRMIRSMVDNSGKDRQSG